MTETELNEQIAVAFPTEDYDNRQREKGGDECVVK